MANLTLLDTPEDLNWLHDVHLPSSAPRVFSCALLYGNEDAPDRVHLWKTSEPHYQQPPDAVYVSDGSERLVCRARLES